MSHIDVRDLAVNLGGVLRGLSDHTTSGPLYVVDAGQQIAVIIRSQSYAPRLDLFTTNDEGWLVCGHCSPAAVIGPKPLNLADAHQTANSHWGTRHRISEPHTPSTVCRIRHPEYLWASCYFPRRHDGEHQSAAGRWPANPDE